MYDCIIIGCGVSGLMASIFIKNKRVLIIEKNKTPGVKLLLTGNGRCNVTNLKSNNEFLENVHNKKYMYSALNNFGPYDIWDFFSKNNVPLIEEKDNRVFPKSQKAKDILNVLLNLSIKNGTKIIYNEEVTKIENNDTSKKVITNKNEYKCKYLIIATGGSSFKMTGSNGSNIKFAKMLKQPTTNIYPCEVGIILSEKTNLAGTSFNDVKIKYKNYTSTGPLIYTHKGLSGEAIMSLGEYIYQNDDKEIEIDFLSTTTYEELHQKLKNFNKDKEVKTFFETFFTKKFSDYLVSTLNLNAKKIKQLTKTNIEEVINIIKHKKYYNIKVDDLNNAYVTGGGIDMKYIDSKDFQSKINKNVYFLGEALDIHGRIGGYNITLALTTGYNCGINIK